jgi:uncharacterized protein YeaO (DUF488 family)
VDGWYDVWLPNLAPSAKLVTTARGAADDRGWKRFAARYEAEMELPENRHVLETLAALSHDSDFSVGCYCEDENRCHRSVLRRILRKYGAKVAD